MKSTIKFALAGGAALAAAGLGLTAFAHHAFSAEFDAASPVLLKGKVTRIEWVNPHTWIHIEAADTDKSGKTAKGTTTFWMVEGGTPNTLLRTGITRKSLPMGTEIVVRGYQSKDKLCEQHALTRKETCKANGRDVTFPDGRKLFMGSSGTGAPDDGADPTESKKTN